jgi:hypothetical protein
MGITAENVAAEPHELNKRRKPHQHYNWWIQPKSNEKPEAQ